MLGEDAMNILKEICKEVYEKGQWPRNFTKSIIVPLEKKDNAVDCQDFRTLSLISHACFQSFVKNNH